MRSACQRNPTASGLLATPTLAISLQLFPASRIAFSLCSSSAVHGVLVRPFFFGGVGSEAVAPAVGLAASLPVPVEVGGAAMVEAGACSGDGRRLRGFEGCIGCGGCAGMEIP